MEYTLIHSAQLLWDNVMNSTTLPCLRSLKCLFHYQIVLPTTGININVSLYDSIDITGYFDIKCDSINK